ncbi:MAG TPA: hypothetical protein VI462_13725 [Acidimicrobiia bacterium]
MADLFVALFLVGFFALCFLYVRACDWIIGPDSEVLPAEDTRGAPTSEPGAG